MIPISPISPGVGSAAWAEPCTIFQHDSVGESTLQARVSISWVVLQVRRTTWPQEAIDLTVAICHRWGCHVLEWAHTLGKRCHRLQKVFRYLPDLWEAIKGF